MRRVLQDLSALFGSTSRPAIATCVFWCCAALAYPLATRGGYAGAVGAVVVFSLSVLFLAYVIGSGALAFVIDAKRSFLPGSRQLARRANLLAALLLLPALVLTGAAFVGNPVWPAWVPTVLVLAIALAGALAPRRPTSAVGLILLVVLAACWTASGQGEQERGREWFIVLLAASLVFLSAGLPLLLAVKWLRVIRWSPRPGDSPSDSEPAASESTSELALAQTSCTASSRVGSWERRSPVQVVRTCLGGMFVQLSRQLIVGAVLLSLFLVVTIGFPWLGATDWRWIVIALALVAAALVVTGFLSQLSSLTRGQIAELALMPGLGAPPAQRRALRRAVLTPPLLWLGMVLLFGSADLLLKGGPLSSVGILAEYLLIMWLTYAVFVLQKLTSLPPKRQTFISEFMLLCLLVYCAGVYYWIYAAHSQFRLWFWFWVTPVLFSIGIASAIAFSVRKLATVPHPFLSTDSANSHINM